MQVPKSSEIVPESSIEGGNTNSPSITRKKQISPAIRWCFTFNNYTDEEYNSIVPQFRLLAKYYVIGKEVGESGTPHLQGYVEFKKKCRPLSHKLPKGIHWKKCKGDRDSNYDYCTKDNSYIIFPKEPTVISELYPWQTACLEFFKDPCEWNCRKIYWIYGDVNIGKTQFVKYLVVKHGAYVLGGERRHVMSQAFANDAPMYCMLLAYGDDMVSYRAIEHVKDGLYSSAFGTETNGMMIRDSPHFLVIGNEPPDRTDDHFHFDKYIVHKVVNNELVYEPNVYPIDPIDQGTVDAVPAGDTRPPCLRQVPPA